jgi:hypothetical protein
MNDPWPRQGDWQTCGKSIKELIRDLRSFEDQDQEVTISIDGGETSCPVSMAIRRDGKCILVFYSPDH